MFIDRDICKENLRIATGVSSGRVTKLGKNENITAELLVKICVALKCILDDICEVIVVEETA